MKYLRKYFSIGGVIAVIAAVPVRAFAGLDSFLGAMDFDFAKGIVQPGTKVYGIPVSPISIVLAIMHGLLGIIGAGAIIMFAVAGIMYMTSAGDEDQATRAKKTATYALIGLFVALGGMVIIQAVTTILKGDSNF